MALSNDTNAAARGQNCFKEAVCINSRRIYDSCSDKDCIDNLQVCFSDAQQSCIDQACSIKAKKAEVVGVYFEVESVPFNKGFYSVDMTFFFKITVAAYLNPASSPATLEGLATFSKKVILFGSEASVKTFSTENCCVSNCSNLPNVSVQVVDPLILGCNVTECPTSCCCEPAVNPPQDVACQFDGCFNGVTAKKCVHVTIGMFSIVQMERPVAMMIPVYDFCIPDGKECVVTTSDDPCELFEKVKFPTDEFFPPRLSDLQED